MSYAADSNHTHKTLCALLHLARSLDQGTESTRDTFDLGAESFDLRL